MTDSQTDQRRRFASLDGLRGVLASVVVLEHFLKIFYFSAFMSSAAIYQQISLTDLLAFPPFTFLHNGAWAVSAFFVLSGFVLTHSLRSKPFDLKQTPVFLIRRYLRFAIPVFVSLLVVYFIFIFDLEYFSGIIELTGTKLPPTFADNPPSMPVILYQGFVSALFNFDFKYNPVLWTMTYEIYGSLMVFGYCAIYSTTVRFTSFNRTKVKAIILLFMLILFKGDILQTFVFGIICYEFMPVMEKLANTRWKKWLWFVVGFLLINVWVRGGVDHPMNIFNLTYNEAKDEYIYNGLGAVAILMILLNSSRLQSFFTLPLLATLGKLSFSIYLTHFLILITLTSWLFTVVPGTFEQKVALSVFVSLPVIWVVGNLFYRFVDNPTVKMVQYLKRRFITQQTSVTAENKNLTMVENS